MLVIYYTYGYMNIFCPIYLTENVLCWNGIRNATARCRRHVMPADGTIGLLFYWFINFLAPLQYTTYICSIIANIYKVFVSVWVM